MSVLENWEVFHFKSEIHSFVLSTEQFLSYIREMRYLAPKFGLAWNSLSPCIFHTIAPNRSTFQRWVGGKSWIFNNMKIYWLMDIFTKKVVRLYKTSLLKISFLKLSLGKACTKSKIFTFSLLGKFETIFGPKYLVTQIYLINCSVLKTKLWISDLK